MDFECFMSVSINIKRLADEAEKGDVDSQFDLGRKYHLGEDVEQSDEKAVRWYSEAAHQGHAGAQCNLGYMHESGRGVEQSYEKAVEWYRKSAKQAYARAQCNLGYMYDFGKGVDRSYEKAVEWYLKSAKQGHARAQCNLGYMYEFGKGVDRSYEEAVEWYLKSAKQDHARAQCNLGYMYESGRGIAQSYDEAIEWYRKSAKQAYARAQCNLGYMYENGRGVKQSYEEAVEWYLKSAKQGFARAQCNLGYMYDFGKGVDRSYEKAVEWYLKSAKQGFARAQFNIGYSYYYGEGVELSYEKAIEWYVKAAEQGHLSAQFNLALCYRNGKGCKASQTESEGWFQKAFEGGDNDAIRYLPHPSLKKHVYPKIEGNQLELVETIKSAFATFQDAVIEIMEDCKYDHDEAVYHFTRWPAIESILPKEKVKEDKNVIRLYHEDYMNDPSEGQSLLSLLESKEFDKRYKSTANLMSEAFNLREQLPEDSSTYMASFTKSSDRLDLWRAYGSDGDGFCFKIDISKAHEHRWSHAKTELEESDNDDETSHTYSLFNVQYEHQEKLDCLNNLLKALKPLHKAMKEVEKEVQEEIKKTIFYMLGEVIYLFKDEQYSSEKEVRMFERLSLDQVTLDESDIGRLYKATGPILFTGSESEIMIGPKVKDKKAVELSIRKRLHTNGFPNTKVTHSEVKYR